jgi:quinolinate synthase
VPQRRALHRRGRGRARRRLHQRYNILEGFEGDKDANGHRNNIGGWRKAGLPWIRDNSGRHQPAIQRTACRQPPSPSTASTPSPTGRHERIRAARARSARAVILCHHYQRADVYQYADLTGDSLKLSRLASQTDSEYVIFCGVHFMAEVADIMTAPHQMAILPDLAAGCSMADMANLAKVERCWRELTEVLERRRRITPVTYINSAADLKAFCGEHGGIVHLVERRHHRQVGLRAPPEGAVLPDQHRPWTGHNMGFAMDEMVVWDPDLELGGLTPAQIKKARILLWKGHCSVHQMFQKPHIDASAPSTRRARSSPTRNAISRCAAADYVGSTEYIVKTIKEARPARAGWSAPNSTWSTAWPRRSSRRTRSCSSWRPPSACARPCSASTRSTWPGRWRTWPRARWSTRSGAGARSQAGQAGARPDARHLLSPDQLAPSVTDFTNPHKEPFNF